MEILYEDEAVRAVWCAGNTEHLLVSFGDRTELTGHGRFAAETAVRKGGIACVGITAREANWYPVAAMRGLEAAVRPVLDRFAVRIGYGGSMGGYGAIRHSRLLGLTQVLALCPQRSIDPAECGELYPGGHPLFRPFMAGHGIRAADVAGRVVLVFDPGDPVDGAHGRRLLAALPDARAAWTPHLGHHVSGALAGTERLEALLDAARRDDLPAIRELVARARRASPERERRVLAAAARTHPVLAARALARGGRAMPDGERMIALLDRLLLVGAEAEARNVAGLVAGDPVAVRAAGEPDGRDAVDLLLVRHGRRRGQPADRGVRTWHGTVLALDAAAGRLRHVAPERAGNAAEALRPVRVELCGDRAGLFTDTGNGRHWLVPGADGEAKPAGAGRAAAGRWHGCWIVERHPAPDGDGLRVAFRGPDGFLCADHDGAVTAHRQVADDWERFRVDPGNAPRRDPAVAGRT